MAESIAPLTVLDSDDRQVGTLYARALLDASQDRVDEVLAELQAIVTEVLDRFPAFEELLKSPRVSGEQKQAILDRTFQGQISPLLLNFLKVLCQRQRVGFLRAIQNVASELREEQLGRVRVIVRCPQALTDEQREQIRDAFRKAYGKQAVLVEQVDPSLLGGLVLRLGDEVIDGSVVGVLDSMRRSIREGVQRSIRDRFPALIASE